MEKTTIIVTGFGPFKEHKINASWEVVKILPSIAPQTLNIIIKEIPVSYEDVDRNVQDLWETHQPKLVIHVGVSSYANRLTIEKVANRSGYSKTDVNDKFHPTNEVCSKEEGCDKIDCKIDVNKICCTINSSYKDEIACISTNAGRYLCEYIFYKSLNIDNKRTMFIHVPPLNEPFTAELLADYLLEIIKAALKQLEHCGCNM